MPNTLHTALEHLGLPVLPRYPMNTTAKILGVSRDQVADLLRLGRLKGTRSSERRWAGVWHLDLEEYLERIHNPVKTTSEAVTALRSTTYPISMKDQFVEAMDAAHEEHPEWVDDQAPLRLEDAIRTYRAVPAAEFDFDC